MDNYNAKEDSHIRLLERLRKDMKDKCRDENPMSLNWGHINDVFNKVRWEIINKDVSNE